MVEDCATHRNRMVISVLYVVDSREKKKHWSGELALMIEGGFIYTAGAGV